MRFRVEANLGMVRAHVQGEGALGRSFRFMRASLGIGASFEGRELLDRFSLWREEGEFGWVLDGVSRAREAHAMVEHWGKTHNKSIEVPLTIRFGDTDPYGVVYFASYFRYCHHGIEEFLRHLGLEPHDLFRNQEEGFGLPVVGAACDFQRPMKYGDALRLFVSIEKTGEKAVTFGFRFCRKDRDETVAQGHATIVAIDRTWKSRSIPERLRKALQKFLLPEEDSARFLRTGAS